MLKIKKSEPSSESASTRSTPTTVTTKSASSGLEKKPTLRINRKSTKSSEVPSEAIPKTMTTAATESSGATTTHSASKLSTPTNTPPSPIFSRPEQSARTNGTGRTKTVSVYFTDGKSIRDQPAVDVRAEGSMLVIDLERVEHTESSSLRQVSVTSTKTMIFPMSRILNATIHTVQIGTEQ